MIVISNWLSASHFFRSLVLSRFSVARSTSTWKCHFKKMKWVMDIPVEFTASIYFPSKPSSVIHSLVLRIHWHCEHWATLIDPLWWRFCALKSFKLLVLGVRATNCFWTATEEWLKGKHCVMRNFFLLFLSSFPIEVCYRRFSCFPFFNPFFSFSVNFLGGLLAAQGDLLIRNCKKERKKHFLIGADKTKKRNTNINLKPINI